MIELRRLKPIREPLTPPQIVVAAVWAVWALPIFAVMAVFCSPWLIPMSIRKLRAWLFFKRSAGRAIFCYTTKPRVLPFIREEILSKLPEGVVPLSLVDPKRWRKLRGYNAYWFRQFVGQPLRFGWPLLLAVFDDRLYVEPLSDDVHLAARRREYVARVVTKTSAFLAELSLVQR